MRTGTEFSCQATVIVHTGEVQCVLGLGHRGLHQADIKVMTSSVGAGFGTDSTATISW